MLVLKAEYTIEEYAGLFLFGGYCGLGIFFLVGSIRSIHLLIKENQGISHIIKTTLYKVKGALGEILFLKN